MQKPTKKQMWMLGIGGAVLVLLFLYARGRSLPVANQGGAGDGPTGDLVGGPTYLTYNNPPREGTNYGGNTYGGITYVSNPPGNCGGKQYYISNDVMSRSQSIEDIQKQVWDTDYRDRTLDQLAITGWRG